MAWLGRGLVLAGLVLIAGFWIATVTFTIRHARSLQSHLQVLEQTFPVDDDNLGQFDLDGAGQHLAGMRQDLEAIQLSVGPLLPAGRWLRWAPKHGGDLAAAADLLDVATRLSVAGDRVLPALSPAVEQVVGEWANPQPVMCVAERFLPLLAAAQPELRAARQELAAVRQVRDRIDAQDLSPGVAGYVQTLDRALPWFETAVDGGSWHPAYWGPTGRTPISCWPRITTSFAPPAGSSVAWANCGWRTDN